MAMMPRWQTPIFPPIIIYYTYEYVGALSIEHWELNTESARSSDQYWMSFIRHGHGAAFFCTSSSVTFHRFNRFFRLPFWLKAVGCVLRVNLFRHSISLKCTQLTANQMRKWHKLYARNNKLHARIVCVRVCKPTTVVAERVDFAYTYIYRMAGWVRV